MEFKERQIRRIVFQVRYEPTGNFIDNRGKLLNLLGEHWNFRGYKDDAIVLKDKSINLEGYVTWKLAQLDIESVPNFGMYLDLAKTKFPKEMWDIMNIQDFVWMGCRTMIIYPYSDFNKMVNELLAFYSVPNDCWNITGGLPSDVGFPFVFENNEKRINLTFGPMKKQQMETQFFNIHDKLPDTGLFIDCDYMLKGNNPSNKIRAFLKDATEFTDKNACDFVLRVIKSRLKENNNGN